MTSPDNAGAVVSTRDFDTMEQRAIEAERACDALRQQIAELQREKAAAIGLQEGTALVVKQLEQQIAEREGVIEGLWQLYRALNGKAWREVWPAAIPTIERAIALLGGDRE